MNIKNTNVLQIIEYICRNSVCHTCAFDEVDKSGKFLESCLWERFTKVHPSEVWRLKHMTWKEMDIHDILINRIIFEVGI